MANIFEDWVQFLDPRRYDDDPMYKKKDYCCVVAPIL